MFKSIEREFELRDLTHKFFGFTREDHRRWMNGEDRPGILWLCSDVISDSFSSGPSAFTDFLAYLRDMIDYYSISFSDLQRFIAWCSEFGFTEFGMIAIRVASELAPAPVELRL